MAEQPSFGIEQSAAQVWFGDQLASALTMFDGEWAETISEAWRERYETAAQNRAKHAAFSARDRSELTSLELWQFAAISADLGYDDEAVALFRAYHTREPDDRDADLVLGRALLADDDAAGLYHIERAAQTFEHGLEACEVAYNYFLRAGDNTVAEQWRLRGEEHIDVRNAARAERTLGENDTMLSAALSEEALAYVRDQLAPRADVKHAWIACKALTIYPPDPLYVIAIEVKGFFRSTETVVEWVVNDLEFPSEFYIVPAKGSSECKKLSKQIKEVGSGFAEADDFAHRLLSKTVIIDDKSRGRQRL